MIALSLKLLKDELTAYVAGDIPEEDIILHNIALMESDDSGYFKNKIVLTLVNTEEESTLKNGSNVLKSLNSINYVEPPIFLNLYLLVSSIQDQQSQNSPDAYEIALHRLSLVLQFFQSKKSFTVKNSPFTDVTTDINFSQEIKDEIKLNVELYTLTFEQINHLWGSLGGKQVPFAMYKVRLVKIQEISVEEAPVIEEIKNNALITNAECDE